MSPDDREQPHAANDLPEESASENRLLSYASPATRIGSVSDVPLWMFVTDVFLVPVVFLVGILFRVPRPELGNVLGLIVMCQLATTVVAVPFFLGKKTPRGSKGLISMALVACVIWVLIALCAGGLGMMGGRGTIG